MPIYEFLCESCGARFERLAPVDAAVPPCPRCRSESVRRRFSVFRARTASHEARAASGGCGCSPSGCGCRTR
jgi:putative FmdB family regulatory protein